MSRSASSWDTCPEVARDNAIIVGLLARPASGKMEPIENRAARRNWLTSVLTDVHFWVPVAVLIGGLLLLESIH